MANIKARRALTDLYKRGVEVRFGVNPETGQPEGKIGPFKDDDGNEIPASPEQVCMFVRTPNSLQREQALRDGNAKRARALINAKRHVDSEEHLTTMAFLADMDDETLFDYVVIGNAVERRQEAVREVLGQDEWKDMTDLQDAMRQFEEMSEEERAADEEWASLLERDREFGDQVAEREKDLMESERESLRILGRDRAEKQALERRSELVGTQAFMTEYERQMLFYSVRTVEDDGVLFFESARQLAEQEDEVRELLAEALMPYISDGSDAKN